MPSGPQAGSSAADGVRLALSAEVERLRRHDAGLRAAEVKAVHQSRVAVRRLRSHLRTFGPLLDDGWASDTFGGLKPLAETLGAARDLDVATARISEDGADLRPVIDPLIEDLAARRRRAFDDVLAAIDGEAYPAFVERLERGALAPRLAPDADGPADEVLAALAHRAWRRLKRRADALDDARDDEAFHDVRIHAKRARYAIEALAAHDGSVAELGERIADLQGILGELQDGVMTREQILMAAARNATDGPFGLAAGVLLERQASRMRAARAEFMAAWGALRRRGLGRKLRGRSS